MKRHAGIVIVAAALASALSMSLPLEAFAEEGMVWGKFVRLTEKKVGEREYVGVVIAQGEGKEEAVVFMGRESKLLATARKLRKGQEVKIAYVTEHDQKWAKRIYATAVGALVRGKFVRLTEKKVGEKEYIAVIVQPADADAEAVLLAKRGTDAAARARKLRKGQQVEISYVTEAGQKWIKRIGAKAEHGLARGKFVRLGEKKVGEKEYIAVVVQPADAKGEIVLLMGRRSEAAAAARKLRKGQQVEVGYVTKGKQKWARRIGPPAAEGQVKDKKKPARRADAPAAKGQVRGKFVRLSEKKVGDREHLAIAVQPQGSDKQVVLLVGRRGDMAAKARKLRKGQRVVISYVAERDHKWVNGINAPGARDERVEKEWRGEIRMLRARLDQLEKKIKAFRAENARLEKLLREKRDKRD